MSEQEQGVRRPGRPAKSQNEQAPVKKGKPTWKPANVTDVVHKDPGKRYRLLNKDPDNLAKKMAEGWEIESGINASGAAMTPGSDINSGKKLTSTYERRDVILASMPEELAQERDAYMNGITERRTLGLTAHLKKEVRTNAGNAPIHGKITIGSLKQGEQVID
jgi:hypothetical protein